MVDRETEYRFEDKGAFLAVDKTTKSPVSEWWEE